MNPLRPPFVSTVKKNSYVFPIKPFSIINKNMNNLLIVPQIIIYMHHHYANNTKYNDGYSNLRVLYIHTIPINNIIKTQIYLIFPSFF